MENADRSNAVFVHRDVWRTLSEAAAQSAEFKEIAQRVQAEFLNYQSRVRRDRDEETRAAVTAFVRDFLPALDAFADSERAVRGQPALLEGLRIVHNEFLRVLAKHGITPVEATGRPFDPKFHEAVGVVESAEAAPDTVVEVLRSGWIQNGRLLRAAAVKVSRRPG